jgi:hypothetical protein
MYENAFIYRVPCPEGAPEKMSNGGKRYKVSVEGVEIIAPFAAVKSDWCADVRDFVPGDFFAAGVFPAGSVPEGLAAFVFVRSEGEGRAGVEGRVREAADVQEVRAGFCSGGCRGRGFVYRQPRAFARVVADEMVVCLMFFYILSDGFFECIACVVLRFYVDFVAIGFFRFFVADFAVGYQRFNRRPRVEWSILQAAA